MMSVREAVPQLGIKQTQSIGGLYEKKNEEFSMLMEQL